MGQLLKNFEAAIIKAGVPIVRPRAEQEIFHITIGTTNSTYPMDIALNDINKNNTRDCYTSIKIPHGYDKNYKERS